MEDVSKTFEKSLSKSFIKELPNFKDPKDIGNMMSSLSSTQKEVKEDEEENEDDLSKEEAKEATGAGSAGGFEAPLFGEPKKNNLFQPGTETKLTKPKGGTVNEDEISGGLADGMTLKDLAKHHDTTVDELIDKVSDGINVEMEHTSSIPIALEIALDHIYEDLDYYGKLEKIEAKEATTSASVGAYDAPIGGGRKDPLQIDTPKSVYGKLRSVKDPNFPKLGGPGSTFVKVKDKCKKFPYCNQGDIKALEFFENNLVKEGIKNISKRYDLNEDYIKGVILENTNIYYKNTNMNKEIENMIDGIVEKVLSEEINKKAKQVTESVTDEIDEMDEFYEIALKRREERMEAKNAKPDFLDLDGDGNKKESMKKASGETDETLEEGFKDSMEDFYDSAREKFDALKLLLRALAKLGYTLPEYRIGKRNPKVLKRHMEIWLNNEMDKLPDYKTERVLKRLKREIGKLDELEELALQKFAEDPNFFSKYQQDMLLDRLKVTDGGIERKKNDTSIDGEIEEDEMEEGNEFSGARQDAIDAGEDEFEVNGKKYPVKESLNLTEEEMIDLIERIIQEEKIEGIKSQDSAMKQSKKETDSYMKDLMKKFKDYLKDGSEGKFDMEPKHFPKGNGELKKMEKMAYTPSPGVEEYIDQIARSGGMENLEYDQIKPNEEWLDKNIVGSSETGNSDEYANAVPTDVNKSVKKRKDDNILGKLKSQSYNKSPQPVTDFAGHHTNNKKFAGIDVKESKEYKKQNKINEDLERMIKLFSHNYKTQ